MTDSTSSSPLLNPSGRVAINVRVSMQSGESTHSSLWSSGDLSPRPNPNQIAQTYLQGFNRCYKQVRGFFCCCSWTSSNLYSPSGFSLKRLVGAYVLYVLFGSVIFRLLSAQYWTFAQSFYYAMTTGLSIGYGAMQPASIPCKVFAIIYVITGACALTLLLSVFVRKLVSLVPIIATEEWRAQVNAKLHHHTSTRTLIEYGITKYQVEVGLWIALIFWIVLGVVWAHDWQEASNENQKWSWITSIFWAIGTVTTTGMIGPQLDEEGKVPSKSAAFIAMYAVIGVPLFGTAVSHCAATYVEAQFRAQARANLENKLTISTFNAVRDLRYSAAAARRSTTSRLTLETRNTHTGLRQTTEQRLAMSPFQPDSDEFACCTVTTSLAKEAQAQCMSSAIRQSKCTGERVLWGDFLALQLLRLHKVDFELLKDLREEYLDIIASNQESGGINWSMLAPLLTDPVDGEDLQRSSSFFWPERDTRVQE